MTLSELNKEIVNKQEMVGVPKVDDICYFDHEGGKLALSTKIKNVTELPSFRVIVGNNIDYHVKTISGLSEQVSVMTPE